MVPRLPIDAGRIAAVASQSLNLAGTIAAQAAPGGRGSEFDISAIKLVVSPANPIGVDTAYPSGTAGSGFRSVSSTRIGVESLLLGGLRTDQANGTTSITPAATDVAIDTRGTALRVPELVLAAQPGSLTQAADSPSVTVDGVGTVEVSARRRLTRRGQDCLRQRHREHRRRSPGLRSSLRLSRSTPMTWGSPSATIAAAWVAPETARRSATPISGLCPLS